MLEFIRNKRRSMVVVLAFAAIVVVFIFWGVGPSGQSGQRVVVGSVNGEKIYSDEYQQLYRNQADYIRNNLKGQASEEMLNSDDFKLQVMQNIINKMLILDEAEDAGISVSPEELRVEISAMQPFHVNGVFSNELYKELLSANGIQTGDFERYKSEELLADKMESRIRTAAVVTPDEVREKYFKDNGKISLNYIEVSGQSFFDKVQVIESEARLLLEENPTRFMIPTQVDVLYAYANFSDVAKDVKIDEAKVKEYYEANKKVFTSDKEISASHILLGPANSNSRAKIDEVMARLLGGADFAQMAKEYSTDKGSGSNGGSLGFFGKGAMVPTFEAAAFGLKVGETSGIIETRFGYHIIKVDALREAKVSPLEGAVYNNIRDMLAEKDARTVAYDRVSSLKTALPNITTEAELSKASKKVGANFRSTGLFFEFDKSEELMTDESLRKAVFRLEEGEVSNIIDSPLGLYVLKVVKKIQEHPPVFEDAKERVIAEYKKDNAIRLAKAEADRLLVLLKGGESIESVASSNKQVIKSIKLFSMKDKSMPDTGIFIGNDDRMFALTKEEPLYRDVISKSGIHYLFSLKSKEAANAAQFNAMYDQIERELIGARSQKAYTEWLEGVRNKSKIEINKELL